jgi:signal transduction histidine kinase
MPERLRETKTARAIRFAAAVIVPPLVAFGIESIFLTDVTRWLLFNGAVIVSAWLGGLKTGLASTIVSLALVWWFLVPRPHTFGTTDPRFFLAAAVFVTIGVTISLFHERLLRTRRALNGALENSERANADLNQAIKRQHVFTALLDNSSDFIGIADPDGKPVYVNPAGRRMVEMPDDLPIESTSIPEYYPADVRAFASDVIVKEMTEHGRWAGETMFRNWRTDESIPVWDTHFMINDPDTGQALGMGTITRDISEFKRARDAIAIANQRLLLAAMELEEAQRLAHIGSWSWDIAADQGRWSAELYRIHQRDPALPAPNLADIHSMFTSQSAADLEGALQRLLEDGSPFELELDALLPDGSHRWVAARGEAVRGPSGEIERIRGTSQDITHLKMLERMKEEWTAVVAHDLRQPINVIQMAAGMLPEYHVGEISRAEKDSVRHIGSAAASLARMVNDLIDMSRIESHRLALERAWVDPASLVRETMEHFSQITQRNRVQISTGTSLPSVFVDRGRFEQILGNLVTNAVKHGKPGGEIRVDATQSGDEVVFSVTNEGGGISTEDLPRLFTRFGRSKSGREPGLGLGLYIARGLVEAHEGRIWVKSDTGEVTTFQFSLPTRGKLRAAA